MTAQSAGTRLRPWVRATLWLVGAGLVSTIAIGAAVSVVIVRRTQITKSTPAEAEAAFALIRERYKGRAPLVEVKDPGPIRVDFRINRPAATAPRQSVTHFQAIVWDNRGDSFVRSSVPVWWMHFTGTNVLARLGVPIRRFTITADDVERYGPGIIIDFSPPGGGHTMVWVE